MKWDVLYGVPLEAAWYLGRKGEGWPAVSWSKSHLDSTGQSMGLHCTLGKCEAAVEEAGMVEVVDDDSNYEERSTSAPLHLRSIHNTRLS